MHYNVTYAWQKAKIKEYADFIAKAKNRVLKPSSYLVTDERRF